MLKIIVFLIISMIFIYLFIGFLIMSLQFSNYLIFTHLDFMSWIYLFIYFSYLLVAF